jgi:hypothetical protein
MDQQLQQLFLGFNTITFISILVNTYRINGLMD